MEKELPITIMRGGTVKAVFIKREDLPEDKEKWDKVFLKLLGSTYSQQIDALGSKVPALTKLAVVSRSSDPDISVEYEFFQVGFGEGIVTNRGSCGNLPSAVGVFAIEEGYVRPIEPLTPVIIRNINTGKIIKAEVPVRDKKVRVDGIYRIDGVEGQGARLNLTFYETQGTLTGRLFPSGNKKDILSDGIPITIIDSGILTIFIEARYLGLGATEHPDTIEANNDVIGKVERIRKEVSELIDFDPDIFLPKFAYVSAPKNYTTITNEIVKEEDIDIIARYFSQRGIIHRSFPVGGGIALATASLIEGTLINEIYPSVSGRVRIGHPSGRLDIQCIKREEKEIKIDAKLSRTARRILSGISYISIR